MKLPACVRLLSIGLTFQIPAWPAVLAPRASSSLNMLTSQARGRTTRQIDGTESLHIALENASAAPRVLLVLMRKGLDDGRVRPCGPRVLGRSLRPASSAGYDGEPRLHGLVYDAGLDWRRRTSLLCAGREA